MAYLPVDNANFLQDLITRKEFSAFRRVDRQSPFQGDAQFNLNEAFSSRMQFTPYQNFVRNFIHPNTPYTRLLMVWDTGLGKTLGSFAIAQNFIDFYAASRAEVGSIFIIGFSEKVFKRELMTRPELGFVTHAEVEKIRRLTKSGSAQDLRRLHELTLHIRRRFTDRKHGGYFQFIGYKALVNRLFAATNINQLNSEEIQKQVVDGTIKINEDLLHEFTNSLLICDEIQNVYNSMEKNNWGAALQYILDTVKSTRAVFMSATPINNSPTEIVDLLNLLHDRRVHKEDFFEGENLKKGALARIKELCAGRISFLMDVDPRFFPTKLMEGDSIPGIKYLKFIRCPMSKLQYEAYKATFDQVLPQESAYVVDAAFPTEHTMSAVRSIAFKPPKWKDTHRMDYQKGHPVGDFAHVSTLGMYSGKYHRMVTDLTAMDGKVFIYHNMVQGTGVQFIGEILLRNGYISEFASSSDTTRCAVCGKPKSAHTSKGGSRGKPGVRKKLSKRGEPGALSVRQVGSKYEVSDGAPIVRYTLRTSALIDDSDIDIYRSSPPSYKEFAAAIQHIQDMHHVEVTTANQRVRRILEKIGFRAQLNEGLDVVMVAERRVAEHRVAEHRIADHRATTGGATTGGATTGGQEHSFMPARFILVHSEVDKAQVFHSIEKFNSPENSMGHHIKVIIGSRMVKEAYNFKAVQHLMVMSRPDNIPMLRQIIGRAFRKGSHLLLPPDMRVVHIRIYTSALPGGGLGYEELKYREKINTYMVVQQIETAFHENAIDAPLNPPRKGDLLQKFAMLDYKPDLALPKRVKVSTFNAFHAETEVEIITAIIKRLFIQTSSVWKYFDLLKAVRNPPFDVSMDPSMVSDHLFNISLNNLLQPDKKFVDPPIKTETQTYVDALYDPHDRMLHLPDGQTATISHVGEFYIMSHGTVESQYRLHAPPDGMRVNIRQFLDSGANLFSYDEKKERFYIKWSGAPLSEMETSVCDFGTKFHIKFIEECIEYVFNVWTNPAAIRSPMHAFLFKMIQFYSIRGLVAWQYATKEFIAKMYTEFVTPVAEEIIEGHRSQMKDVGAQLSTSGIINLLKSSVNNSILAWCPSELEARFKYHLDQSLQLFAIKDRPTKVPANMLPVGHFLNKVPTFYHPDKGWFASPEYMESSLKYRENDIIVGMDTRSKSSMNTRFKLRLPRHIAQQYKDKRKILKGSVCASSKSKGHLIEIAKKIGIQPAAKLNVTELCSDIRSRLIYLDLKERLAGTNVKWFWFQYESDGTLE
jgi:hypothetical protein